MPSLKPKFSPLYPHRRVAESPAQKPEQPAVIKEPAAAQSGAPLWQKAFALAENVRFTRTPHSETERRRAEIDPAYAKILAEAEERKNAHAAEQKAEAEIVAEPEPAEAGREEQAAPPAPMEVMPQSAPHESSAEIESLSAPEMAEPEAEEPVAQAEPAAEAEPAEPVAQAETPAPVNAGHAKITQMQHDAEIAFSSAPLAREAASVFRAAEESGDVLLPAKQAQEERIEENSAFPWLDIAAPQAEHNAAEESSASSARSEDFIVRPPAVRLAPLAPETPSAPVAQTAPSAEIAALYKAVECRRPQMRWIPVPAEIADAAEWARRQNLGGFPPAPQGYNVPQTYNAPQIPAAPQAAFGYGFSPALPQAVGAMIPTLNLQVKLGGSNSGQDRLIWEHGGAAETAPAAQSAPVAAPPAQAAPAAKPAPKADTANLDALCSSAVEKSRAMPAAPHAQPVAQTAPAVAPQAEPKEPAKAKAPHVKITPKHGYHLPSLGLLQEPVYHDGNIISQEALERSAGLLESILEDFGVKGEIIHVRPGPVVTLYEFEPAPGVKSSRVIGLADDIARSMSSVAARVAVIPGRNVIGIELPNKKREMVFLREILQSNAYKTSDYKLPLALGKNIGGEPIIAELAKMPHLLVAGTTGSGKSVAINTMILSLLYRMTPQECRLIMVDPKMLELSVYDGIPHLLTPVVTDPKKAITALKWAVREMEERYRKMAKLGVRNIDGFNARVKEAIFHGETIMCNVQAGFDKETGELLYTEEAMDLRPLPYIVIIVDEMADLMMVAGKEIEGAIQRLAQMARAAGIHLIMATQRPSVDVITGTIKANFPTRISFQVTSKIDSRTILGEQGAEALLGQGDMLHMAGGGRLKRVHGPFVSDREVEQVVDYLKTQGTPEYLATVTESNEEEPPAESKGKEADEQAAVAEIVAAAGSPDDLDDLYLQAVKIVMRDKKCSTSYIQRRLGIGYNKAATLVEKMEEEGLVGEANHVGKREILPNN